MKRTTTLLLLFLIAFSGAFSQRHEGRDSVTIAYETFSGFLKSNFDTDFKLWARPGWTNGSGSYSWPWSVVKDSGAFTTKNGTWISGSDSSIRIIIDNYGGIDDLHPELVYDTHAISRVVFLANPNRYSGSWDTLIWKDIDIENVIDMNLVFCVARRSNASNPAPDSTQSGLLVSIRVDGGPWITLDTSSYGGLRKLGMWTKAIIPLDTAIHGSKMDVCWAAFVPNQQFITSPMITGWADIVLVNDFIITAEGGANTITTDAGTLQMYAQAFPKDAKDTTFTWSVQNVTGIATIDQNGLLTADCNGTVLVIATANDFGAYSETYEVTLTNQTQSVSSITVKKGSTVNGNIQMLATVLPACANNTAVTWSVTNGTGSATINSDGLLTPTSSGQVTVVATAQDGSGVSGSLTVIVVADGINDYSNNSLMIYPSPAYDKLNIESSALINYVEVLSLSGAKIFDVRNVNNMNLVINTSSLSGGLYLIKVHTTDGTVHTSKFVKQ